MDNLYVLSGGVMNVKLTLKLDKTVIEKAKLFAMKRNESLSEIVGRYFEALTEGEGTKEMRYGPIVQELSGIISPGSADTGKTDYDNYLAKKYK